MANHRLAAIVGLLGSSILLAMGGAGYTQDDPAPVGGEQQEGVEVLARGPIHEAYAGPNGNRPQEPSRIVPKQPPDPIPEVPPDEKPADENVKWFPGYWAWDEERNDFIWVSGIWRAPPPDRQWVPGHWVQAEDGWQWVAGLWLLQKQDELHFLPPPPEPVQARPSTPPPSDNSVYVPGTWVYRETRYNWRPGYWCDYRPGWVWVPAHYVWTPAGYIFVDGYWDYDLSRRGLLFAPVYFPRPLWVRPAWYYRPHFVVETDFVLGSLFVRAGSPYYYFGDYFEPVYRGRGFVPWIDISFRTPFGYDPLLSYYRWSHRDGQWERELRGLYAARFRGDAPRPPRTLVQQTTLIQNITVNKTVNVTNVKNVTALTSLKSVDRTVVKLQPVSQEQRVQEERHIQDLRQFSRQRAQVESQILAKRSAPVKPTDPPHTVKVDLPQSAAPAKVIDKVQAPPLPVVIKPTVRPAAKPDPAPRIGTPHVADVKPEPKTQPKPEVKPVQPVTRPDVKPEPKPQPKTEVKPPSPTPRPEVKPEPKPQPKPEVKPPAPTPRPEVKPEPKPQPKPEVKPPAPTPRPEVKPEPKPQPKPEGKPPAPTPRPEVKPEPKPQPKPEGKPPTAPADVRPEPKPRPQLEVKPPTPMPRSEAKPEPKPMPRPDPKPEVKPPSPPPRAEPVRPSSPPPSRSPATPMKPDPGKSNPQDKKP